SSFKTKRPSPFTPPPKTRSGPASPASPKQELMGESRECGIQRTEVRAQRAALAGNSPHPPRHHFIAPGAVNIRMKVLGLTGGIGMGKSACAELIQQRGIPVI